MRPQDELSETERDVAMMVWEGMTNVEIARSIGKSEQMVKNHLRKVFDKLGVWTRLELALYIAHHGGAAWGRQMQVQTCSDATRPCGRKSFF